MPLTAEDGRKAALEDRAIGAGFDVPDETLPEEYRTAYVQAWRKADDEDDEWSAAPSCPVHPGYREPCVQCQSHIAGGL